ncbi:hypothetical protein, partial [Morganella morganii]|uniref:hypothetical protein n=1 Tax=Morganella morganii TaxID=582 RepID=UPI003305D2FB
RLPGVVQGVWYLAHGGFFNKRISGEKWIQNNVYFPPNAKKPPKALIHAIRFRTRIQVKNIFFFSPKRKKATQRVASSLNNNLAVP